MNVVEEVEKIIYVTSENMLNVVTKNKKIYKTLKQTGKRLNRMKNVKKQHE